MTRPRRTFVVGLLVVLFAAIGATAWQLSRPRQDDGSGEAIRRGLEFLLAIQGRDGGWPSYKSRTPDFASRTEQPPYFPTMFVVMALRPVDVAPERMLEKAVKLISASREANDLWSVDGPHSDLRHRYERFPCTVQPDADSTATALVLTADAAAVGPQRLAAVKQILDRHRNEAGLYCTYLLGEKAADVACPADFGNRPSFGVNLNVLLFFARSGLDTGELATALGRALDREWYWEEESYYSLPVLSYLAANADANGAPAAFGLLARMLRDERRRGPAKQAHERNSIDLAALLVARSRACAGGELQECEDLGSLARELRARQHTDGGWGAAPLYTAGVYPDLAELRPQLYGSEAETTALAVRALFDHERQRQFDREAALDYGR